MNYCREHCKNSLGQPQKKIITFLFYCIRYYFETHCKEKNISVIVQRKTNLKFNVSCDLLST